MNIALDRGDFSVLFDLRVFTLKAGMELFHITPKNIPFNTHDGDRSYLLDLPRGKSRFYTEKPLFFSLDEFHTIYYDQWIENQWASTHLAVETTDTIKVINFGRNKPYWNEAMIQYLSDLGIDGWVAYDDNDDLWREIMLFEPRNKMRLVRELNHKYFDHSTIVPLIYPLDAAEREQTKLNKYVIASTKLLNLIIV